MSCRVAPRHAASRHLVVMSPSRRGHHINSRNLPAHTHTTPAHTTYTHTTHIQYHLIHTYSYYTYIPTTHTTRLMRWRNSPFYPRLPAFRLPAYISHLNFTCGVIRSYYICLEGKPKRSKKQGLWLHSGSQLLIKHRDPIRDPIFACHVAHFKSFLSKSSCLIGHFRLKHGPK